MTSLKLQLNKLADAHTQWQLTDSESRKRASFLYDPKVASTLDRETIYCLGTNGFEELCLLDSGFEEFERVLFSDTSLTFERSIQTKEVNDSLNLTIRRFLIRLSPYFLLSPAHKALEWLVHRFFIHFYNIDDLIRCILPYHEHNYFTRAIQMFRLNDKQNSWTWLESAQKAGTTISGLVMANHCATDLGFLNFICESTAMAVKEFGSNNSSLRVIINFYIKTLCSTILHSLSHKKKKKKKNNSNEENFLAHLMPYLLKGLKSKCVDYKRANYLILSHLSNIFTFQINIKDEILNVLSKGFSDDLIKENLLIISVFLTNQHHQSIPDRCFNKLCDMSNIIDEIYQLTTEVRIDNFLCAWFEKLLDYILKTNEENLTILIEKTLNTIKFNSNILKFIINCFIKQFNNNNNTYLISLASIIERKYPIDFDENIRQQTENCLDNDERKRIREFASMTAIGFKHQPLSDRSSLAICLNHPQAQLRIEALQRIREGIQLKQNIEQEFLIDVLLSRLNDNEANVVNEAIYLLEDLHLFDNQQINDILQKILQRENQDWVIVQQSIVRLLTMDLTNEHKYLHLLFPTTLSELNLLNNLLENYKQQKNISSPLLKLTKKIFKSITIENLSTTIEIFIQSLVNYDDQENILVPLLQQHDEVLRLVEHHRPNWIKFSIIYILLGIQTIKQKDNNEYIQLSAIMIFKLLKKLSKEISPTNNENTEITDNKALIDSHVIKKYPFTSTSYSYLWRLFIHALPKDHNPLSFWNDFLSECIQWLCSEEKISFINLLCNEQFPLGNKLVQFLGEYYLNLTDQNYEQEILLKYLLKHCQTTEYTNLSVLIFSFFLHSSHRNIRSVTMKIFQTKLICLTNDFDIFIQTIKHHENEIITDSEYICYLISQLIQTIKLNEKKKRKLNFDNSSLINLFKITIDKNNELNQKYKQQLNIQLLYLLKQCKHWSIFNEYRNDFENLLSQSEQNLLIIENKIFIENFIQHIDFETLIHEQSLCFEIILQILKRSIKKSKAFPTIDIMILTLKQFTPEMFGSLSSEFDKQIQLIEECFSLWQRSKSSQLTTTIKTTLSNFHFDAKHFLTYWKTILEPDNQQNISDNRLSNKKLIVSTPNEPINSTINWKKLLPSLELLHNDQLLINHRQELIRQIFHILEKSLNQTNEFEQKTYIHQLCTTALLNLYTQLKSDECNPDNFNSEIVMECMKRTNDLHTTQQCLMLLSKGAQLFPEKLISMIMAMFAFVGDRLVRKDDLYSYQVMEKTIKTVIPSLYKEKNIEQRRPILAKITHVFVTSLAHLPAHRRQDIFRMLMESIGQDECLWFAPIQLFDSILLSPINRKNEETLKKSLIDGSEQMLNSFNQFSSSTILINSTRILNVVLNLPDQIIKNQSTPSTYSHLIDLRLYTTKHIHVLKYQLLTFINNILSADFFVKMIKNGLHQENELNYLNELIQAILHCVLWANKLSEDDIDVSRYNKSVLNKIYDCLNKSIALLNGTMFVNIILNLLQQQQTNEKLQRKTLEILNIRLKDEFTPENEIVLFLPHMDNLLSIVSKYSTHEQEQTSQTTLFTIKLLAKRLGEKHPTEFSSSLTFISQHLRLIDSGQHANLSASIYLCLAELCATLKVYSIAELPSFMPHVLQTYQSDNVIKNELLLTSVIACLSKLVRTLCNYLTPYLPDIIKRTCTLLTHPSSTTDQRLRTMWSHIALHVPHRLLFPILYDVIDKNEFILNDLEPLMTLLKQSLSISTLDDLSTNYSLLKQLFLKLFTLRTIHTKKMQPNQMNIYEDYIFDCFSELVMRLSEETFRPLFYTIYEWAVYNEPPPEYTLTFYRLTFILSKKLKGLFTLFAGHIIQHSANILNRLNSSKTEEISNEFKINFRKKFLEENKFELINGILGTISNLCLFDSVGFITDERFQLLMMPIVDQLENFTSNDDYSQWIQQYVSPCIVNLTSATKEESLWRQIHYQILLKTRSDLSKIRLSTLNILQELSRKLGMNYQNLLPEAIPFMAELMEDPNDEVEKTCHRVIIDMESTLGESLQDYFNN